MTEQFTNTAILKKFTNFLEAGSLRKTPERFAILDRILLMPHTFTIEQLNEELEKESYHVSRATVYNTVELLIKAGILRKLFLDGVQMKYERISNVSYTYLICTHCGKFKEVKDIELSAFMNARTYNAFTSSHFSMCVYGVCNSCARKLKKKDNNSKTKKLNKNK